MGQRLDVVTRALFAAHESVLDQKNTDALSALDPSQLVIAEVNRGAIDNRFQLWSSPLYRLVFLCDYSTMAASAEWELLEHTGSSCVNWKTTPLACRRTPSKPWSTR